MTLLIVSERELGGIARKIGGKFDYNASGFVLISYGAHLQHHIRLDLQKWDNGRYAKLSNNIYEYLVSSFHVKREAMYSSESRQQKFNYLYFTYAGGGVWQPVWAYDKTERGASNVGGRRESEDVAWGVGMTMAHEFLADLSDATGSVQCLAMGPMQGKNANLVNQL